jgi:site-specific DNA-methyltransferase (adenine-specific)
MIETDRIYHEDCLTGMQRIDDESVDVILTDPPYLYLKNQKLDRPFDEAAFFSEAKRILKKDGFIVLFGRGTSFYRWNTMLADLGFKFKEEVVWDKIYNSSPVTPIQRYHESTSISTKGKGILNRVKVPYTESKEHNFDCIVGDIKRIASSLGNTKELDNLRQYMISKKKITTKRRCDNHRGCTVAPNSTWEYSIPTSVLNNILNGSSERDIIRCVHDRYSRVHPTQKPVRLLERLLALVSKEGDLVVDPFSGSASTAIAALNTGRSFIGFEIDEEYFNLSVKRVNEVIKEMKSNLFSHLKEKEYETVS